MHPPVLARFREFDDPPASPRPLRSEDVSCDSTRGRRLAKAQHVPGNPRTRFLPCRKLPQAKSIERYAEIARPGFLLAGRRSKHRERSMETYFGNGPRPVFHAARATALAP